MSTLCYFFLLAQDTYKIDKKKSNFFFNLDSNSTEGKIHPNKKNAVIV